MLTRFCVPQKRTAIFTCRREQTAVRTEVQRFDVCDVSGERHEFAFRSEIPDLDRVVSTAGCEQFAVTTKCEFVDSSTVTFQVTDLATTRNVPHLHLADGFDFQIFQYVLRIRSLGTFGALRTLATHHRGKINV